MADTIAWYEDPRGNTISVGKRGSIAASRAVLLEPSDLIDLATLLLQCAQVETKRRSEVGPPPPPAPSISRR